VSEPILRDDENPVSVDFLPASPFYCGTVVRVNYGRGTGLLRTGSGREIRFAVPFVEFVGGRRIHDLAEGMEVGFDVGWTSRGLRVTKIKVW
jgi:hypothetical protein